jgi:hypothetical protein
MKYPHLLLILTFALLLLVLAGCAANAQKSYSTVVTPPPDWFDKQPESTCICIYGTATKTNEMASTDAAKADAWFNAPKAIEIEIQHMMQTYVTEAYLKDQQLLDLAQEIIKDAASTRFANVTTGESYTEMVFTPDGEKYKTYIQVRVPKAEINKALLNQISMEEDLYNQLQASPSFVDLDENTK